LHDKKLQCSGGMEMNISVLRYTRLEDIELSTPGCHRIYKHMGQNLGKISF